MVKKINEIFYSLQGEGRNTGCAAVFIRFAGCNLQCPFCDTDFTGYQEMTDEQIVARASEFPARFAVLTGGEPALHIDARLIGLLHDAGFRIAIETNGTRTLPDGIDWVTVSPKVEFVGEKAELALKRCDELKCVYNGQTDVSDYGVEASYYYLQPCDVADEQRNIEIRGKCIEYILGHPQWRLSLQIHKICSFK
ncbi:7-carboxy-7-deazaguanine synthase QueE [Xylanibacter muris]|uniref:7-carboxy-7-deazaguanine synthase n=1 Tax=Xylanibacter muris TaxID=2736290 RepID=A0ABX2AN48_9BACT|nr:7-carboxy-7-deazaguanine synthase QueE [Xylanibacter muris]NPD91615.1 radical SAM protein [Xylanibacter muris]